MSISTFFTAWKSPKTRLRCWAEIATELWCLSVGLGRAGLPPRERGNGKNWGAANSQKIWRNSQIRGAIPWSLKLPVYGAYSVFTSFIPHFVGFANEWRKFIILAQESCSWRKILCLGIRKSVARNFESLKTAYSNSFKATTFWTWSKVHQNLDIPQKLLC